MTPEKNKLPIQYPIRQALRIYALRLTAIFMIALIILSYYFDVWFSYIPQIFLLALLGLIAIVRFTVFIKYRAYVFAIGISLFTISSLMFGEILRSAESSTPPLGAIITPESTSVEPPNTIQVDRGDDPNQVFPCTEAANDCSLRSAINIANSVGVPTVITFTDHFIITLVQPLPLLTANHTIIRARPDQEIHIDGNNVPQSVLFVTGANITLEGLRVYGAGMGYSNISIGGGAYNVTIARNLIGDDDILDGGCGQSDQSYGGIYVGGTEPVPTSVRAWIYGNIIECHRGGPGEGITVATDKVVIGQDSRGNAQAAQRNVLRWNRGYGVNIGEHSDNIISNSLMYNNEAGNLFMTNFDNDYMDNEMR